MFIAAKSMVEINILKSQLGDEFELNNLSAVKKKKSLGWNSQE
jgi:hypothetical protein